MTASDGDFAESEPSGEPGAAPPEGVPPAGGVSEGPVSVVWCRQVDNEAESPGYTTVPEEFPGRSETLETIRLVGNLTINVADTQDYWIPGNPAPLSYYPNLFLYPAFHGRYTCIGRMFLSTEDRPRLGMKTLVLDTQQLIDSGEFGASILRWHGAMAGARKEGSRPPPSPDPRLYGLLGEGLLFHRGSTNPVVVVAARDWESVMEAVFDLVRSLPASLLLLGAILAFPYFLPQGKTNMHEFAEQIPLGLAVMRIPPSESVGDRLERRIGSWATTQVTLRNLLAGIPEPSGKGREQPSPLVLQYIRDHNASRLGPITQRVDLVELPKLRAYLADPDRATGKDRRKEMWRIGTAMESAALLLQRARGRRIPLTVDASKRTREYLRTELPTPGALGRVHGSDEPEEAVAGAAAARPGKGGHPNWLSKPSSDAAEAKDEVVPISRTDDPSLLPPGANGSELPPIPPSAPASPALWAETVRGTPPPISLTPGTEDRIRLLVEERMEESIRRLLPTLAPELLPPPPPSPPAPVETPAEQLHASETRIARALTELDSRWQGKLAEILASPLTARQEEAVGRLLDSAWSERATKLDEARETTAKQLDAKLTGVEKQVSETRASILAELAPHAAKAVEAELTSSAKPVPPKFVEAMRGPVDAAVENAVASALKTVETRWEDRFRKAAADRPLSGAALESAVARFKKELDASVRPELQGLADRLGQYEESTSQQLSELETRRVAHAEQEEVTLRAFLETKLQEVEQHTAGAVREAELRFRSEIEEDAQRRSGQDRVEIDSQVRSIREELAHSDADQQVRMQLYIDEKLRELRAQQRASMVGLLARFKGEIGPRAKGSDPAKLGPEITSQTEKLVESLRAEFTLLLDRRLSDLEERSSPVREGGASRIGAVERRLDEHSRKALRIEQTLATELSELDRRLAVLSERLLPVVRKSWIRIAEVEKGQSSVSELDLQVSHLRRDIREELRRQDEAVGERIRELRDRMEATVAHQGKVWLTLIRHLSQLAEDRRGEPDTAGPVSRSVESLRKSRTSPPLASPEPEQDEPRVHPGT